MSDVPAHLRDAQPVQASEDALTRARELAEQFYLYETERETLEARLEELKKLRNELAMKTIPEFFGQHQISRIGLIDHGADISVVPYYFANIAKDWPEEERAAAFRALDEMGGGPLIRAVVSIPFMKDEWDEAKALMEFIRTQWPQANSHPMSLEQSVPWNSLTSFVRECSEAGDQIREELKAVVGQTAKLKKRK